MQPTTIQKKSENNTDSKLIAAGAIEHEGAVGGRREGHRRGKIKMGDELTDARTAIDNNGTAKARYAGSANVDNGRVQAGRSWLN